MNPPIPNNPWSPQTREVILRTISQEIREEVEGFVEALDHPKALLDTYLRRQVLYELGYSQTFACSGILATKADGTVIHGRNLDLGESAKWSDRVSFYAEFVKGGKPIVRAVTFLGNVGVNTGVRLDGGWSIEQNTRFQWSATSGAQTGVHDWIYDTLTAVENGGQINQLEVRRLLLEKPTFLEAVDALSTTKWIAPQYFVIGGANKYEGAVVTVGRAEPEHFYDVQLLNQASGNWFLVQTNDDHWKEPLDDRRDAAAKSLKQLQKKREIVEDNIMTSLRKPPVCNSGTIFSWVITPSTEEQQYDSGECQQPYYGW